MDGKDADPPSVSISLVKQDTPPSPDPKLESVVPEDVVRSTILADQIRALAQENAALRRGYRADMVKARETFEEVKRELADRNRLAQKAEVATWKLRSIRRRRWWRIGAALGSARRNKKDLLRLPLTLWQIVRTKEPALPRPEPKSLSEATGSWRSPHGDFEFPPARIPDTRSLRRLVDERRYDEAMELAERLLEEEPTNIPLLDEVRHAHLRRGELEEALAIMGRIRSLSDDARRQMQERHLWGRLRELSPLFIPRIPGRSEKLEPVSDRVVMHLLKESEPYFERGYTMRSRSMLQAQRSAGYEPFVVTSLGFPRRDGFTEFDPVEVVDGVEMVRLDAGAGYDVRKIPWDAYLNDYAWLAGRIAKQRRPAIIHAGSGYRGFDSALVGLAIRRRFGIPLIYDVRSFLEHTWTEDMSVAESSPHYTARYATEVRCMQQADFVLTIGNAMRQDLIARGIPDDKIGVVPNAVDTSRFVPRKPSPALLDQHGLTGRESVVGYISNLSAREGIDTLVEAIAHLRNRGRDVACFIVGEGPERTNLAALVDRLDVGDAVVFAGQIPHDEIPEHYALIDIFVVPRKDDYAARLVTPLKPFEAMAMGLPVVVADLPGLVEVAASDERGLSFASGDAEDLSRAIAQLLDNPELARQLAANGRSWVVKERSWDTNARRYEKYYEAVLSGRFNVGGPA